MINVNDYKIKIIDLNTLKRRGIIKKVIGTLPREGLTVGLDVWARKSPKESFLGLIGICKTLTDKPLKVFVDDLCARMDTGRTVAEQKYYNNLYKKFFINQGCEVYFSSDVLSEKQMARRIYNFSTRLTFNDFVQCLPLEKRVNIEKLSIKECGHLILQLMFLDCIKDICDVAMFGAFSEAVVYMHRQTSNNPLSCVIVPKVPNNLTDIKKLLASLENKFTRK